MEKLVTKRIGVSGRIVIPKDVRTKWGVAMNSLVDIYLYEGDIVMKRSNDQKLKTCLVCNKTVNDYTQRLVIVNHKTGKSIRICTDCYKAIKDFMSEGKYPLEGE